MNMVGRRFGPADSVTDVTSKYFIAIPSTFLDPIISRHYTCLFFQWYVQNISYANAEFDNETRLEDKYENVDNMFTRSRWNRKNGRLGSESSN